MEIDDEDSIMEDTTGATDSHHHPEVVNPAEAIAAPSVRGGLNPEAARLFRVYRTMANMLSERGYMVPPTMREMTPAQFKMKFGEHPDRESLTVLVEKVDDEKNQLFVFFPTEENVGVKQIKTVTQRMHAEGVVNAIMVLKVDMTAFAKTALLETMVDKNFRIEHFKETELLVDITQHTVRPCVVPCC
jgi:DNA-directed RNA polymerases I, II, and III subunit RPABC1